MLHLFLINLVKYLATSLPLFLIFQYQFLDTVNPTCLFVVLQGLLLHHSLRLIEDEYLVKFGRMVFEIYTDTCTLIAILQTQAGDEAINACPAYATNMTFVRSVCNVGGLWD